MTDLQKITKEVNPTSLAESSEAQQELTIEDNLRDLLKILKAYDEGYRAFDEGYRAFDEGRFSEKNKSNSFTKIIIDLITFIFDQDDPKIENVNELLLHKQNKKFIKESLIMLLGSVKHYNIDDKKVKLMLTGKLIQSLYESKK